MLQRTLPGFDGQRVRFKYKDYRDNDQIKIMPLEANEFLRRFLLHIPPSGFMCIRHYGLLANRYKAVKLARCREILKLPQPESREPESAEEFLLRTQGIDLNLCPVCKKGRLHSVGPLPENHATGPP